MDSANSLGRFEDIAWPMRGHVIALLRKWSPGQAQADYEDIVSEAFRRAWLAWPKFVPVSESDPEKSVFNWLVTISKNQAVNLFRKRSVHPAISLDEFEPWQVDSVSGTSEIVNFDARIHNADLSETLRDAILSISPAYREVVYLIVVEELSYVEVAEIMNIPLGTVMSRLSRGRAALRQVLTPDDLAA